MRRLLYAFSIATVVAIAQINLMAIGTGTNYCGSCWSWWGDHYWIGALFCALNGC